MDLPNLSGLSFATDAKLFEHVATRGGGKTRCIKHTEPIVTSDDEDSNVNCAVDGYLMFKAIDRIEGAATPIDYSGKLVDLLVEGQAVQLQPLLKRARAAADRKSEFQRRHTNWINRTFPIVCSRGSGLLPVTWDDYGEELAKITEWYFLDEAGGRGHIFLQLLDTPQYKLKMHMPTGGTFSGRYLYVALVCAAGGAGYGKYLMKLAEAASRALGCDGIALASLSNSAGFYYSLGYKFVSKWDGVPLDVSAWTELVTLPDGRTKTMLRPELDVNPFGQPRDSSTKDLKRMREEDSVVEQERGRLRSLFDETVKRARGVYSQLAALSFM